MSSTINNEMSGSPGSAPGPSDGLLQIRAATAGYGKLRALDGVDISVPSSSVVALLGANGAGKTTMLRMAAGLVRQDSGSLIFDGADLSRHSPEARAKAGICLIPEGRGIFRSLSVRTNLELQVPPWIKGASIDAAVERFPVLGTRLDQIAGSLSGGEQQMLALCRAHLSQPKLVLADEVSLGLAPLVVDAIYEDLANLASSGLTLLLVEQYVDRALALADYVYVLSRGRISWHGPSSDIDQETLVQDYLGQAI